MRKIVVVGAAAILSLGVGGTALAASNGLDSSGLSVRPASTAGPSHDANDANEGNAANDDNAANAANDDNGGNRPAGVTDDGVGHDANEANDANDVNDDHGGD